MAQQQVSMRKIKEILRLRYDLGLRQDQIARSCHIGQATVHRYLERFAATELKWPLPEDCDEARLERLLFATRQGRPAGPVNDRAAPDFTALDGELQKHKHLTLQLLWEEYRGREPRGYGYSRYVAPAFMLPWDAGPQEFCSSTAPAATLIDRVPGL